MNAEQPERLTRAELKALKQEAGINLRAVEGQDISADLSFVGSYELLCLVSEIEQRRREERKARKTKEKTA